MNNAKQAEQQHLLQVYAQYDFEPVSAAGLTLTCRDGSTLLDFYGGHAVAALGYGHPALTAALATQADTLLFQSNAVALEGRARAAARLADFGPAGLERVFFCNSGAEANDNALRIALRATGRNKVLAIEHGFHGRTAAAGAVTWGAESWYGFPQKPFAVEFIPRDDADAAERLIDTDTAAVILEPVQGIAGAHALDANFVSTIARACRAHGALLIADEVQSGMGRCGVPFAIQRHAAEPDILTAAKSLGGGFPCAAVLLTPSLAAVLGRGDLGSTFGGAPLACAMINTVLDVIEQDALLDNVNRLTARMREECVVGPVAGTSGQGFLLGLTCPDGAAPVRRQLLERGILTGSSNDPNVIRLLPPLTLGDAEVDQLRQALHSL